MPEESSADIREVLFSMGMFAAYLGLTLAAAMVVSESEFAPLLAVFVFMLGYTPFLEFERKVNPYAQ